MASSPIIFTGRGLDLDTRINIFGRKFHVHSSILKQKSEFFFRLMDAPYNASSTQRQNRAFKYEWISRTCNEPDDQDNDWNILDWDLVAEGIDNTNFSGSLILREEEKIEIKGFHNLLRAMYGESYSIKSEYELAAIVRVADYFLALPVVGNSILGALHHKFSTGLCDKKMLEYACKLHQAALLQEYVVAFAGVYNKALVFGLPNDQIRAIKNAKEAQAPEIQTLIDKAVQIINIKLSEAHQRLFRLTGNRPVLSKQFNGTRTNQKDSFPAYYRRALSPELHERPMDSHKTLESIRALLERNLKLGRSGFFKFGHEGVDDDFFFVESLERRMCLGILS